MWCVPSLINVGVVFVCRQARAEWQFGTSMPEFIVQLNYADVYALDGFDPASGEVAAIALTKLFQ